MNSFSHLLIEAKNRRSPALKYYQSSHTILDSVDVFSHIQFDYAHFPPLRIRKRPAIFILENNRPERIRWPVDSSDVSEDEHEAEVYQSAAQTDSDPFDGAGKDIPEETLSSASPENDQGSQRKKERGSSIMESDQPAENRRSSSHLDRATVDDESDESMEGASDPVRLLRD